MITFEVGDFFTQLLLALTHGFLQRQTYVVFPGHVHARLIHCGNGVLCTVESLARGSPVCEGQGADMPGVVRHGVDRQCERRVGVVVSELVQQLPTRLGIAVTTMQQLGYHEW